MNEMITGKRVYSRFPVFMIKRRKIQFLNTHVWSYMNIIFIYERKFLKLLKNSIFIFIFMIFVFFFTYFFVYIFCPVTYFFVCSVVSVSFFVVILRS